MDAEGTAAYDGPRVRPDELAAPAAAGGLPDDPALPALRAIARDGAEATLRRAGLAPPFDELAVLKAHAGRRCTFALRAADGRRLVAKAYRRGVASQIELFAALERSGLATGDAPTAPRLIGHDAELRLLVFERLDGPCGRALIARGDRVGALAGAWLLRQWGAGVAVGRAYGAGHFLLRVEGDALAVTAASPELGEAAGAVLARMSRLLPQRLELALVHGSFSVNHVVDLGTGAGVVDWDGACQGPRELDAATFLATLAREAGADAALALPAAQAAETFAARLAGTLDPSALAWFGAGARIRNARHLCVLRLPGWAARSERLLASARALLCDES